MIDGNTTTPPSSFSSLHTERKVPDTLVSLFNSSNFADRVQVGLVQQNAVTDEDCTAGYCTRMGTPLTKGEDGKYKIDKANPCPYFSQIKVMRLNEKEAKGPVYARALQAQLVPDDTDFCMQIDAHTRFIEGWDNRMLNEWGKANNEYAVLSTYPTNVHDLYKNSNNHWEMPHLCYASFAGKGKVANNRAGAVANLERPILAPLWAAGLSFHRCHAERNVPNDINLKSIFAGEEYGRGSRLWTHGYDFYSISRPVIGTYYGGGEKLGGGTGHMSGQEARESADRLATLLKWPGSDQSPGAVAKLGSLGLGTRRKLEKYGEWCGVDTINQKIENHCILSYVDWDSHDSMYAEYQPTGPEVVKDAEWRRKKEEAKLLLSTETKDGSGNKDKETELLLNIVAFVVISSTLVTGFSIYVGSNYKRIVKPTISKFTV
eukprot:CAMPEP_0167764928 /NCGR_PEP_ID=MMETSP0110_2-20121227/14361_1 /TAXON_ID=629695 /ORGANISM="Gymnochlora sp., Strain CCMP2014" /LENGTH=431 /DNA_ID=CAMNT_0007652499 /DNA_START=53 /DNA_END=1347 /DNA_ORIENTATION=-